MATTYTSGPASISVDDAEVVRHLDRVSDGAASQFVDVTGRLLRGIQSNAVSKWPVRTGASKRGFSVVADVGEGQIRTRLLNTATGSNGKGYAWFVRYSVRTRRGLQRELDQVREIAQEAEAYSARGGSPQVRRYLFRQRALEGLRRASLSEPLMRRVDNAAELVETYRRLLERAHGQGADSEALAGKSVWSLYVRRPANKAKEQVVSTLQEQINALAGR